MDNDLTIQDLKEYLELMEAPPARYVVLTQNGHIIDLENPTPEDLDSIQRFLDSMEQ